MSFTFFFGILRRGRRFLLSRPGYIYSKVLVNIVHSRVFYQFNLKYGQSKSDDRKLKFNIKSIKLMYIIC
jgi:hypothetical protein